MAFDREKKYYVQTNWKGFFPGMELDVAGYSDHKLEKFLDEGIIAETDPTAETDTKTKGKRGRPTKTSEEVPPVNTGDETIDKADASLPENRRSDEATGQPNPDADGTPKEV